jgi:predicted RNase H-like nuclease (RuvC/YqgF family)
MRDVRTASLILAQVVVGLVLAFVLGRYTAPSPSAAGAMPGSEAPTELRQQMDAQDQAEEQQKLQRELAALKRENGELKADVQDLKSKLSIAADTVNKQQIELREVKRRAEEAEWKASQSSVPSSSTALPP